MSADNNAFVSALLAPQTQNSNLHSNAKSLIQEIDVISPEKVVQSDSNKVEGPTMLQLMMAAQADAQNIKKGTEPKSGDSAASRGFGNGFKKGFFESSTNNKKKSTDTQKKVESKSTSSNSNIDVNNSITTLKPSSNPSKSSLVLNEVQEAMTNTSETTFLNQLKQGEWVTDDLMTSLSANTVLAAGFKNLKCLAAMEFMQKEGGPQEAKKRFAHDAEVNIFLKEFGYVMSNHFVNMDDKSKSAAANTTAATTGNHSISLLTLASSQGQNKNLISDTSSSSRRIDQKVIEIGPLHAQVLKQKDDINDRVSITMRLKLSA